MERWIKLNPNDLALAKTESIQGVNVKVFVPPHQIPEAVKGFYNKTICKFIIEFKYIGNQEELYVDEKASDENVKFKIGKKSGRLFEIELDVDKIEVTKVILEVIKKLENRVTSTKNLPLELHTEASLSSYMIAKTALKNNQRAITSSAMLE